MTNAKTVVPGELAVADQPRGKDIEELSRQGYRMLINNRPDNEDGNQPTADENRKVAEQQGMKYVHIPVTVDGISRRDVDAFREALKSGPLPAVAHCGTGKRSYLLWAAGEALYEERSIENLVEHAHSVGVSVDGGELPRVVERCTAEPGQ